jgi:hypothetical protein
VKLRGVGRRGLFGPSFWRACCFEGVTVLVVKPGGASPAPTREKEKAKKDRAEKEKAPRCWPRRLMKRYKLTSFA